MINVDETTNNYFIKYYSNGSANWRTHRVQPYNLVKYIEYCWTLSYEQCLLDLMQDGYSMCVVSPMIKTIHARMDAEYEAYMIKCEQELNAQVDTLIGL